MSVGVALLVSADAPAIQQVSQSLQELSISPDICREPGAALRLLNRRKFDAVIIDLQLGDLAQTVLDEVRLSPSNRTAVTFAITPEHGDALAELRKGSDFVFERPVSPQSLRRVLKPAYGLILRERRRYFRCPAGIPVVILRKAMAEVRCQSVNISEGGMALSTFVPLKPGENVQVRFALPGHSTAFLIESTVCWCKTGHLGVRFLSIPVERTSELQTWLADKLEELLPDYVSQRFEKVTV